MASGLGKEGHAQEVDHRGNHKSPITPEVGVRDVGTKDRSDPNGAYPIGHIIARPHCALS